ncbi:cyclophilin-like fold protein [Streptomyces albidoflavus]
MRPRRSLARVLAAAALLPAGTACADGSPQPTPPARTASATPTDRSTAMDLRVTLDGRPVGATLHDTPPARDFAKLLPLTLELEDFHDTERVAGLPRRLDTSGAPEPVSAEPGDIAYYAPWGNLALFHRDGPAPSADLLVLGRLDADAGQLGRATRITIEAAPSPTPRSPS